MHRMRGLGRLAHRLGPCSTWRCCCCSRAPPAQQRAQPAGRQRSAGPSLACPPPPPHTHTHQTRGRKRARCTRNPHGGASTHLGLELLEAAAVQQASQHRPHVKGLLGVRRDDACGGGGAMRLGGGGSSMCKTRRRARLRRRKAVGERVFCWTGVCAERERMEAARRCVKKPPHPAEPSTHPPRSSSGEKRGSSQPGPPLPRGCRQGAAAGAAAGPRCPKMPRARLSACCSFSARWSVTPEKGCGVCVCVCGRERQRGGTCRDPKQRAGGTAPQPTLPQGSQPSAPLPHTLGWKPAGSQHPLAPAQSHLPLVLQCSSAPPSSSAVTSSPVAALTSGGPPRKMVPLPLRRTHAMCRPAAAQH